MKTQGAELVVVPIKKEPLPAIEVQVFRLRLCEATATLVKTGLDLVGVSAPYSM